MDPGVRHRTPGLAGWSIIREGNELVDGRLIHKGLLVASAGEASDGPDGVTPGRSGSHGLRGGRYALIVAGDTYEDPKLKKLRAPARDAEMLGRVLADPEIGNFEVKTLFNEPSHVILEAVEDFFSDRRRDDLLFLYFSGHGLKSDRGNLYFATVNTKTNRLDATAVPAPYVNNQMDASNSRRIVMVLDCCYAGAFDRRMAARSDMNVDGGDQFQGSGRVVITASGALEYAFEEGDLTESEEARPSFFTRALVHGLSTGDADADLDGLVEFDELFDYISEKLKDESPRQTPRKWVYDVKGKLYIARRSGPVTQPAELPEQIVMSVESPYQRFRLEAVDQLERLLRGNHLGYVLAARVALERLADDDSRMVASKAKAVLEAASAKEKLAPAVGAPGIPAPSAARPVREEPRGPKRRVPRRVYVAAGTAVTLAAAAVVGLTLADGAHGGGAGAQGKPSVTPVASSTLKPSGSPSSSTDSPAAGRSSAPAAGAAHALPSSPLFKDEFVRGSGNWTENGYGKNGGTYSSGYGSYLVYSGSAAVRTYREGLPTGASAIYPAVPGGGDMKIAIWGRADEYATIGFGPVCRARADGSGYYFGVWGHGVYIDKIDPGSPGVIHRLTGDSNSDAVNVSGTSHGQNIFLVSCVNSADNRSVQLTFQLNGQVAATYTDTKSVINGGSIALAAGSEPDTQKVGMAEFAHLQIW